MTINDLIQQIRNVVKAPKEYNAVTQAVQMGVPATQLPSLFEQYIFNPKKQQLFPQSMYYPENRPQWNPQTKQLTNVESALPIILGMTAPVSRPATNYIGGVEQGTPIRTGSIHTPGTPNVKKPIELLIYDETGKKVGSRIYPDTVSAQKAYERIVVPNNGNLLVRQLDQMPGPDGLVPEVKPKPKPSTGGEIPKGVTAKETKLKNVLEKYFK